MTMPGNDRSKLAGARESASVALVQTNPDRIIEDVRRVMELANWKQYISPGADVSLKPNLGWDKLIPGAISAPWVVEAVILSIQDYVGKIYLVESDQVVVNVEKVFRLTQLDRVCQRYGVTWVNMSKGNFIRLRDDERLILQDIYLPEILTQTELISLPLLKTHNKTTITGALKNQWGCLQTLRHNFHLVLPQALADVNNLVQPRFAVMDGTVGLEGNGPKAGRPKEMNVLLASANLVGLDTTASRLMGFDPDLIPHLELCAQHGLGGMITEGEVVGETIPPLLKIFMPAKHNVVSWLELALRKSLVEWLIFNSPLLHLFSWGARRYYDLWDLFIGRKIRKNFFAESPYRHQWTSNIGP